MQNLNENIKYRDGNSFLTNDIPNISNLGYLKYCYMCRNIFDYYGINSQKNQLIQELGELIVAITKDNLENIIEEMADVQVMLDQFRLSKPDWRSQIDSIKQVKVRRQIERMSNDYKSNNLR